MEPRASAHPRRRRSKQTALRPPVVGATGQKLNFPASTSEMSFPGMGLLSLLMARNDQSSVSRLLPPGSDVLSDLAWNSVKLAF